MNKDARGNVPRQPSGLRIRRLVRLMPAMALVAGLSVFWGSVSEVDGQVRSDATEREEQAGTVDAPALDSESIEISEAEQAFRDALPRGSFDQRYERAMRLGQRLMDAEQFVEAGWAFRTAVCEAGRHEPEGDREALALLALGRLQTRTDRGDEAHHSLSRALWILEEGHAYDPSPLVVEAFRSLNELYVSRHRWSEAESVAQQWRGWVTDVLDEQHPANLEPMDRTTDALLAQDRVDEAEAVLDEAVDLGRTTTESPRLEHGVRLSRLARVQQDRDGYASAIPIYHEAYDVLSDSLGPDNPLAVSNLTGAGACLREMGELDAAVKTLDFAASLVAPGQSPSDLRSLESSMLPVLEDSSSQTAADRLPEESMTESNRPIDAGTVSPDGMVRVVVPTRNWNLPRSPEQIAATRAVARDAAKTVARYEAEYAAYYESEQHERERRAAALEDSNPSVVDNAVARSEPLVELSITHLRRGDAEAATDSALRAARTAPENSRPWYAAGIAAMETGAWSTAAARFDQAIRREPDDPNLRRWRCLALGLAGEQTQGISELRTFVALHRNADQLEEPDWDNAQNRFLLGDINAAELLAAVPMADGVGMSDDDLRLRDRYCQAYYLIGCREVGSESMSTSRSGARRHVARLALDWSARSDGFNLDEQFMAISLLQRLSEASPVPVE